MKNFIFISPNFPASYWKFCAELKNNGMRVLGIGDCPYDLLKDELKNSLHEYYKVSSLENYDEVFKTDANGEIFIEGLRIGKYTVTEVEDEVSAGYKRPDPVEVELVADETLTVNVHNDKITIEEPPKTGDNSNMGLWFGLLMLSCLGMVGTVFYGRRRRREDAEV